MMPQNKMNRRQLLGTSAVAFAHICQQRLRADGPRIDRKHYDVVSVNRTTVRLPYREIPRRNMDRELPHWRYCEICDVKLKSDAIGTGETMLYYTWGVPSEDDVARVTGKNAIELMWDDSLGAGLQMALFDAVGRTAGVPVHCLLGPKTHEQTPLSWWNIDTSAADMAAECAEALRLGYRSYKTKGRPWFDIRKQLEQSCNVVPPEFKIDMDFNNTLLTAEQGLPILKELEKYSQVDIYETPIPQIDVAGNRRICEETRVHIAMHYGKPDPAIVVREQACDGFVVGHGATAVMRAGHFASEADMPFWLQLVGAGMTAAFSLHFGGVLSHATWPAVNCHQLFQNDLLTEPIVISEGSATVPDKPGIGYEVDRDLLHRFKVERPESRPEPARLIETTWPDGRKMYTASNGRVNFMLTAGMEGKYPYYVDGADTRLVPNDGSSRWRELYQKARDGGPVTK